jgi:hypothetical protein
LKGELGVFQLDRGFQILLTGYPAVKEQLDLQKLGVRCFGQGAVLAGPAVENGSNSNNGSSNIDKTNSKSTKNTSTNNASTDTNTAKLSYVANPLTCPRLLFATIKCAVFRWGLFATLRDVFRIVVHLLIPWLRQEPYARMRAMLQWERGTTTSNQDRNVAAAVSNAGGTAKLQQPLLSGQSNNQNDPNANANPITTAHYLEHTLGISLGMRQEFLRPFFEAIYVSSLTQQSPAMFDFVLRALAFGGAALPKNGMGAVPQQLMEQILKNSRNRKDGGGIQTVVFHFEATVEKIVSLGNNEKPSHGQKSTSNQRSNTNGNSNCGGYSVVFTSPASGGKPTHATYDAVILAVEEPAARGILGEQENANHERVSNDTKTRNSECKSHTRSATFYFALPEEQLPVKEPLIVLQRYSPTEDTTGDSDGTESGKRMRICNVGFPSVVQSSYAPKGYHLAAVTVAEIADGRGSRGQTDAGDNCILFAPPTDWVLSQVAQLLNLPMSTTESWTHIRTYTLDYHQPMQVISNERAFQQQRLYPCLPVEAELVTEGGAVVCGDYTSHPTLDGAMRSGVRAGTLVADRLL